MSSSMFKGLLLSPIYLLFFISILVAGENQAIAASDNKPLKPLSANACNQIKQDMAKTLKSNVTTTKSPVQIVGTNQKGMGCHLMAQATGKNIKNFDEVVNKMETMLTNKGWVKDAKNGADGPGETMRIFRKGNNVSMLMVTMKPLNANQCPSNQPISACLEKLQPKEIIYSIILNNATK